MQLLHTMPLRSLLLGSLLLSSLHHTTPATAQTAPLAPVITKDGPFTITQTPEFRPPGPIRQFIASPDGKHWAVLWEADAKTRRLSVTADGKLLGTYGGVKAFQYTAAGKLVYVTGQKPFIDELNALASPDNEMALVIDGKPGHAYALVHANPPQLTGPTRELQTALSFSADGHHVACVAFRNNAFFVEINGNEFPTNGRAWEVALSHDATHFGWITANGEIDSLAIDNAAPRSVAPVMQNLTFSRDGSTWAYLTLPKVGGGPATLVREGANPATYKNLKTLAEARPTKFPRIGFSNDGKHLFYQASTEAYLDGNPLGVAPHWGLRIHEQSGQLLALGEDKGVYISLDGQRRREESISQDRALMAWSPDGQRLVWAKKLANGHMAILLDNDRTLELPGETANFSEIAFGPGNKLAMAFFRQDLHAGGAIPFPMSAIIENHIGAPYDGVGWFSFGPEGSPAVYGASKANKRLIVVDTTELAPRFDRLAAPFTFATPNDFHFFALNEGNLLRVRVQRAP